MTFPELIAGFGAKFNVDDLVPDADGNVTVLFDDFQVMFHYAETRSLVLMVGELGELPPENGDFAQKQLLEANYLFLKTSGATLCLNPENARVTLCRTEPLEWLDVERFSKLVDGFVNDMSVWTGLIKGYGAIDGDAGRLREQKMLDDRQIALGGFIRV